MEGEKGCDKCNPTDFIKVKRKKSLTVSLQEDSFIFNVYRGNVSAIKRANHHKSHPSDLHICLCDSLATYRVCLPES